MTKQNYIQKNRPKASGGHTTISPPAKVKSPDSFTPEVLASGVDTLNLALDISWKKPALFEYLDLAKETAQEIEKPFPFFLNIPSLKQDIYFNVQPNGSRGYRWLISGSEYALRIGNWVLPKSRPSAMLEIRSETIWTNGLAVAIEKILAGLEENHAKLKTIKPSRVDLCMDILVPKDFWNMDLFKSMNTRAQHFSPYFKNQQLTGAQIGKGKIVCRMYDKPLEIKIKSNKKWMYLVWGISEVPENMKVIRIEFQIRRELIKSLGINTIKDAFPYLDNIWAYCTFDWLKFQTNPGKHHTQRKILPWWKTVQTSFDGISAPVPAIRAKAAQLNQSQLAYQIAGLLTSFVASEKYFPPKPAITKAYLMDLCGQAIELTKKSDEVLAQEAEQKRAKYFRTNKKYKSETKRRIDLGLPTENQIFEIKKAK
ncbi:hypothetical protein OAN24_05405 [Pseudodesulfovibrio sp.]|nr:hypothetical protein [Pseudodesulfovibrio sp.]